VDSRTTIAKDWFVRNEGDSSEFANRHIQIGGELVGSLEETRVEEVAKLEVEQRRAQTVYRFGPVRIVSDRQDRPLHTIEAGLPRAHGQVEHVGRRDRSVGHEERFQPVAIIGYCRFESLHQHVELGPFELRQFDPHQ